MEHTYSRRSALKTASVAIGGTALPLTVHGTARSRAFQPESVPIGSILPLSGGLERYGQGMKEGVDLAVVHVNEAGGPVGRALELISEDSESDPETVRDKYDNLLTNEGLVGFVGAGSSDSSLVLAERVADDRVMQVSPSSTSPALAEVGYDEVQDVKYFSRTAPNDSDQGVVMSYIMETHMNADTAAFLYINNLYGEELAAEARKSFNGHTLRSVRYSPETTDYSSTLDRLFQDNPDAIGFIGYLESGRNILQTWADGDYGGQLILSEGLDSTALFQDIPDIVEGVYVISPNPEPTTGTETFHEELGHEPVQFSANAYDALFLMALAMHQAGEASGTAIATNLRSVSQGGGVNVTVNEFRKATELLDEGTEIDYQGASGPVNLNENLEPSTRFEISRIRDGYPEVVEQVPRTFFTDDQSPAPTGTPRDKTSAPTGTPRDKTSTPTTVTDSTVEPLPGENGNDDTGILFPLLGAGSVGWLIGFFTGNTKREDIKRNFLNVLLVAFGSVGVFGLLRWFLEPGGSEIALLITGLTFGLFGGILVGIYLRKRDITITPSEEQT